MPDNKNKNLKEDSNLINKENVVKDDVMQKKEPLKNNKFSETKIENNSEEKIKDEENYKKPQDATFFIRIYRGNAYLQIIAPKNGGNFFEINEVLEKLNEKNIVFGIDEKLINVLIEKKEIGEFKVAEPRLAVNGKDGKVIEYFKRKNEVLPTIKKGGNIDFKKLTLFSEVSKGEPICKLVYPDNSMLKNGMDIFGVELPAKEGVMPNLPIGQNVCLSEDELYIIAECEGRISFKDGKFNVEDFYKVNGNVDINFGSIDFNGSVFVTENIVEGYSVNAKGSVVVNGSVLSGNLTSGGDVEVKNGINGGFVGTIKVKGDLKTNFIENATVICGGNIYCHSILNSNVICDGFIHSYEGKGYIHGGSITAFKGIKCKIVGSNSNVLTTLSLGVNEKTFIEYNEAKESLLQSKRQLQQIEKNIGYIEEKFKNLKEITPEHERILIKVKKDKPVNILRQRKLQNKIKEIENIILENKDCHFEAEEMYIPFKITFHFNNILEQKQDYMKVKMYMEEDKVILEKNGEVVKFY